MSELSFNEDDLRKRGFQERKIKELMRRQNSITGATKIETKKVTKDVPDVEDVGELTTGDTTAAVAGIAGDAVSKSDKKGTDTNAQAAGGALSGAAAGFAVGGPWGAAIGGVIGGVSGALQADANREANNREVEATRVKSIADIQNKSTAQRNTQVNSIISGLSRALLS